MKVVGVPDRQAIAANMNTAIWVDDRRVGVADAKNASPSAHVRKLGIASISLTVPRTLPAPSPPGALWRTARWFVTRANRLFFDQKTESYGGSIPSNVGK